MRVHWLFLMSSKDLGAALRPVSMPLILRRLQAGLKEIHDPKPCYWLERSSDAKHKGTETISGSVSSKGGLLGVKSQATKERHFSKV